MKKGGMTEFRQSFDFDDNSSNDDGNSVRAANNLSEQSKGFFHSTYWRYKIQLGDCFGGQGGRYKIKKSSVLE